jgi:hypothetical protein
LHSSLLTPETSGVPFRMGRLRCDADTAEGVLQTGLGGADLLPRSTGISLSPTNGQGSRADSESRLTGQSRSAVGGDSVAFRPGRLGDSIVVVSAARHLVHFRPGRLAHQLRSVGVPDEAAANDEPARRPNDSERAPGHSKLAVISFNSCVNLQSVAVVPQEGVDLKRHAPPRRLQAARDLQLFAGERGHMGDEPDLRVLLDVEEVSRAEVLVALGVVGAYAGPLDRQLDSNVPL